jgi:transcriptional regulator with XRE-family HTH domain
MITGEQVKAARKLLRWSQIKLADEAGIDLMTVTRFEAGERYGVATASIIQAILQCGVEFPFRRAAEAQAEAAEIKKRPRRWATRRGQTAGTMLDH